MQAEVKKRLRDRRRAKNILTEVKELLNILQSSSEVILLVEKEELAENLSILDKVTLLRRRLAYRSTFIAV